jgi:hypothetical protein
VNIEKSNIPVARALRSDNHDIFPPASKSLVSNVLKIAARAGQNRETESGAPNLILAKAARSLASLGFERQ